MNISLALRAAATLELRRRGYEGRRGDTWRPSFNPFPVQQAALDSPADELLYGGQPGGGKSHLLIGAALTQHRRSIIFRREYPQLRDIEATLTEMVSANPASRINRTARKWQLPGGQFVETGAVQHEWNWARYKGRPHDFIGFDELVEFTRNQYRMLITWLRSSTPGQRCRVISATNAPMDEAQRWVIEDWAPWLDPEHPHPASPGELRWYAYEGDRLRWFDTPDPVTLSGVEVRPVSRTFIPAQLSDNPVLSATDYGRRLDALPEDIRRAIMGDFSATAITDPYQVIPRAWVDAARARWVDSPEPAPDMLGVDPARGGRDQTVIAARRGNWFAPLIVLPGRSTPDGGAVAAEVMAATSAPVPVVLDVIGIGSAVYDALVANGVPVTPFNAAEASTWRDRSGRLRMANVRAEAYWRLREALDPGSGMDIALPPDDDLREELIAPRWSLTLRGVLLEPKSEVARRIGRSPDRADAVVMALWGHSAATWLFA